MRVVLIVLLVTVVGVLGGLSTIKTLSAGLKDTSVNGLEGLNIRAVFPFNFDKYVVGFKHSFTGFGRAPDALFVRRSFATGSVGEGFVNAEYNTQNNVGSVNARWQSQALGVAVSVNADTQDKLQTVEVAAVQNVQGVNVGLSAAFDVLSQKISSTTTVQKDSTALTLHVDTVNRNPELSLEQHINENNIVNPTISLTTGDISYGWIRKWAGGSLRSALHPGDKLTFDWKDESSTGGAWNTHAEVPIDDVSRTKVSVSRDWQY